MAIITSKLRICPDLCCVTKDITPSAMVMTMIDRFLEITVPVFVCGDEVHTRALMHVIVCGSFCSVLSMVLRFACMFLSLSIYGCFDLALLHLHLHLCFVYGSACVLLCVDHYHVSVRISSACLFAFVYASYFFFVCLGCSSMCWLFVYSSLCVISLCLIFVPSLLYSLLSSILLCLLL